MSPVPVELRQESSRRSRAAPGARQQNSPARGSDAPLRCRACGTEIASWADHFRLGESGASLYVNPHGRVFDLLMFTTARHLLGVGEPTTEHTWFAGYAWQIVVCARCGTHLGWEYFAIGTTSPRRFLGLLRTELVGGEPNPYG